VQIFTEYGLLESIFGDETRARFPTPPEARDTPDILIYVDAQPPVLIAIEPKMYDRPTSEALELQMARQRKIGLDYLAPIVGIPADRVFQLCLLPEQLLHEPDYASLAYPVLTWQSLHQAFTHHRSEDYWLAMLRLALDSYDALASRAAKWREHADGVLRGADIYERVRAGDLPFAVMGRNLGLHGEPLTEDVDSGRWRKQRYEVGSASEPHNANWFLISEFVALVDTIGNPSTPRAVDHAAEEDQEKGRVRTRPGPTPVAMRAVDEGAGSLRSSGKLATTPPELFAAANDAGWNLGFTLSQLDVWQAVYEWAGFDFENPPPDGTAIPLDRS